MAAVSSKVTPKIVQGLAKSGLATASISVRKYMRWPPAPPEELTSTLVLTSPGRRFVDIRVLLPKPGVGQKEAAAAGSAIIPLARLDWAFAGTSSSRPSEAGDGSSHSRWAHWIDSKALQNPEAAFDEGDMFPQPDGTTLEKGRGTHPVTGLEADMEELWEDVDPVGVGEEAPRCVVLRMEDAARSARGMVVLLGRYCQGLTQVGDSLAAERWEWGGEKPGSWTMTAKLGTHDMPCRSAIDRVPSLSAGEELQEGGHVWKVVESE